MTFQPVVGRVSPGSTGPCRYSGLGEIPDVNKITLPLTQCRWVPDAFPEGREPPAG